MSQKVLNNTDIKFYSFLDPCGTLQNCKETLLCFAMTNNCMKQFSFTCYSTAIKRNILTLQIKVKTILFFILMLNK